MPKPVPYSADQLARLVDQCYRAQCQRAVLKTRVEQMTTEIHAMEEQLIQNIPKSSAGIKGRLAQCNILVRAVASVVDWDLLYVYLHKHKAYELLQRRLSREGVLERLEAGRLVPGVTINQIPTAHITRCGQRRKI